jgi:hypothetical protein
MTFDGKKAQGDKVGMRTRLFAFGALSAFLSGVGWAGHQVYRAAADSFVAPIILSPDNDVVLEQKLKLDELVVERAKTAAEVEAVDADLAAGEKAAVRLQAMVDAAANSLAWTRDLTKKQATAVTLDLRTLERQKQLLADMTAKETRLVDEAKANMDASLISKFDYAKEQQSLDQVRLASFENERTKLQSDLVMQQVVLTQQSLANERGAPATPEEIMREYQLGQVELEQVKLEAEMRAKRAERRVLWEKLAKIDEIESQLRARPVFQATSKSMDVAFVPYTQIDGVARGAEVFDCVWGLFSCKPVGKVAELVPGEVILPDPWGNQARGQYAVLDLESHESAKSKTLRIRPASGATATRPANDAVTLSRR